MSLAKTIPQPTGNDASYWQLHEIVIYPKRKELFVEVHGYKDKATFDAGGAEMAKFRTSINPDVIDTLGNTTLIPALKTALQEIQAVARTLITDLSDSVSDDTDVI